MKGKNCILRTVYVPDCSHYHFIKKKKSLVEIKLQKTKCCFFGRRLELSIARTNCKLKSNTLRLLQMLSKKVKALL